MTLRSICASAVARFTAMEVLPVPPLPPVTAMTCTWAAGSGVRSSAGGMDAGSVATCEQFIIGTGLRLARKFNRTCDQLVRPCGAQIIGNDRTVAQVRDRQLRTRQRRPHP